MADVIPALTVYGRSYCHLCDDMVAGLRKLGGEYRFKVTIIDVDGDPEHEKSYGERVPVLVGGGRELCHYFLDDAAVTAFLVQFR